MDIPTNDAPHEEVTLLDLIYRAKENKEVEFTDVQDDLLNCPPIWDLIEKLMHWAID